jgi:hypothetical protein
MTFKIRSTIIFLSIFALLLNNSYASDHWGSLDQKIKYPLYVKGTYADGSNITEPRPQRSKYLEVKHGGIIIVEEGAGFYLNVRVIQKPEKPFYIKIQYQDPRNPGRFLANDMEFTSNYAEFLFSSPEIIHGIVGYQNYSIVVSIYEDKDSGQPQDVLTQTVRAYVETQTSEPLIFHKMRPR